MITKSVQYAYASSPQAEKLGHGRTGCWISGTYNRKRSHHMRNVRAHIDQKSAIERATTLADAWDKFQSLHQPGMAKLGGIRDVATEFADRLAATNDLFDREHFLKACGVK